MFCLSEILHPIFILLSLLFLLHLSYWYRDRMPSDRMPRRPKAKWIECQGDRRPSDRRPRRLYAKQTECQADWMPSILCFYTRFCQFVRLIIGLIISLFARYTKGRGKNSRFFQTFAKMGFFGSFLGLDQGVTREICRFSERHRGFSSLSLLSAQYQEGRYFVLGVEYTNMKSHEWNIVRID